MDNHTATSYMINNSILQILEKLISFESVTPKSANSIEYIADFLSKIGFKCEIKKFDSGKEETTNLYAILGHSSPNICFAGHVDVVPPMNENLWKYDPFKMTIQDDIVYGRGVVDMKGSIACYLSAISEFLKNHKEYKGSISLLLTSDEEGDAKYGTQKMLEHIKDYTPKVDFCILGEPTSKNKIGDTVKIGRRGSVNFTLKVIGKQGHVAYPKKAINPIPFMIRILNDLSGYEFDKGSEYFQQSNLEITSVDTGNPVTNVIPESVSTMFNIRFNDKHTSESLTEDVIKIIEDHGVKYDLQYKSSSTSFIQEYSPIMQDFVQVIKDVCGITPNVTTCGGTSDARFIHSYSDVIELGLDCNLAHKINESSKISDLQALHKVYYDSLVKFML